jgi:hypothetical protein
MHLRIFLFLQFCDDEISRKQASIPVENVLQNVMNAHELRENTGWKFAGKTVRLLPASLHYLANSFVVDSTDEPFDKFKGFDEEELVFVVKFLIAEQLLAHSSSAHDIVFDEQIQSVEKHLQLRQICSITLCDVNQQCRFLGFCCLRREERLHLVLKFIHFIFLEILPVNGNIGERSLHEVHLQHAVQYLLYPIHYSLFNLPFLASVTLNFTISDKHKNKSKFMF